MAVVWFTPEDQELIIDAFKCVLAGVNAPAEFNWSLDSLIAELKHSKMLIYKTKQKICAFILFRDLCEELEIIVLATDPLNRKKSCMTEMMTFLKAYAAQQGKLIRLEVHQKNATGIRFYEKHAFVISRIRKNYYQDGGDAREYIWKKHPQPK